jgi:hypothetical protein
MCHLVAFGGNLKARSSQSPMPPLPDAQFVGDMQKSWAALWCHLHKYQHLLSQPIEKTEDFSYWRFGMRTATSDRVSARECVGIEETP